MIDYRLQRNACSNNFPFALLILIFILCSCPSRKGRELSSIRVTFPISLENFIRCLGKINFVIVFHDEKGVKDILLSHRLYVFTERTIFFSQYVKSEISKHKYKNIRRNIFYLGSSSEIKYFPPSRTRNPFPFRIKSVYES